MKTHNGVPVVVVYLTSLFEQNLTGVTFSDIELDQHPQTSSTNFVTFPRSELIELSLLFWLLHVLQARNLITTAEEF